MCIIGFDFPALVEPHLLWLLRFRDLFVLLLPEPPPHRRLHELQSLLPSVSGCSRRPAVVRPRVVTNPHSFVPTLAFARPSSCGSSFLLLNSRCVLDSHLYNYYYVYSNYTMRTRIKRFEVPRQMGHLAGRCFVAAAASHCDAQPTHRHMCPHGTTACKRAWARASARASDSLCCGVRTTV